MVQKKLSQLLQSLGMPLAYHHFVGIQAPPYIVYLAADADAWGADEKNAVKRTSYIVELYTAQKDSAAQARLESLFDENGIRYGCVEAFLATEKLYQVAYHIDFTTKIRR